MNAAKGRLRTILFLKLWSPCRILFNAKCTCRKETLYDYQAHLCSINVWPLEEMFGGSSINDILRRLANFSFEPPATACEKCRQNYKRIVKGVISEVQGYFGGLCLDCIDKSKPKTGDVDIDYWMHAKIKAGDWSKGCRFRHGEPTWYFSFSGRKEDMDDFLDKWKAEEEERVRHAAREAYRSESSP